MTLTLTPSVVHTRREYIRERSVDHETYYAQFVNDSTLAAVDRAFGVERLRKAFTADHHLNSIPLAQWDQHFIAGDNSAEAIQRQGAFYSLLPFDRQAVAAAGETVTRAVIVCIAKRAARILIDRSAIA